MSNVVMVDGRIVHHIEIKQGQSGKNYCNFSIACNRDKETTDFIDCSAFGSNADFLGQYFDKGAGVNIIGRLQQNTYTGKDGEKKSKLFVLVDRIGFPIQNKTEKEVTPADFTSNSNPGFETLSSPKDMEFNDDSELPFY